MKNKYRLLFPKYIYIIGLITASISFAAIIFNIIKLFGIEGLPPFDPIVDVISLLLASIIVAVVLYSLYYSRFRFTKDIMVFHLSLFQVRIPYQNMLLLRHDPASNLMLLYYNHPIKEKPENIKYVIVNISLDVQEEFIAEIKKSSPHTIYEIFDKHKEE